MASKADKHARYACHQAVFSGFPAFDDKAWELALDGELKDVESGERPFLHTAFRFLRDDKARLLYLRFLAEDDGILSTYRWHDEPLYTQDVFELFVSENGKLDAYKEIEVSPYDVRFTGTISYSKEGERSLNMDWDLNGFVTRTSFDQKKNRSTSVWAMPYDAFLKAPSPGTSWRFNVFRVDHSIRGESLQAWQHTGERNFHVPKRFAYLDFV